MAIPTKHSFTPKVSSLSPQSRIRRSLEGTVDAAARQNLPAFIIADLNSDVSTKAVRKVINSIKRTKSDLIPMVVQATTPEVLNKHLAEFNLGKENWTYPSNRGETKFDIKSGLKLSAYNAKDINKVIACAVSHMRLWALIAANDFPAVILEHDALFTRRFRQPQREDQWGVIGLNDPRGATRKSNVYLQKVLDEYNKSTSDFVNVPYVDDDQFAPQGIAGNSAYFIHPNAASSLIAKVEEVGLWPNDALMCKQFFPFLRQAYPFYTTLQGVASTTQG